MGHHKVLLAIVAFCIISLYARAAEDDTSPYVHLIKKSEEIVLEIKSVSKAKLIKKTSWQVLDPLGQMVNAYYHPYNRFISINSVLLALQDASGKEIKRIRKKDLEDIPGSDEATLMTDTRYKKYNFYYNNYPYTITREEETEFNGIFDLPDWYPQMWQGEQVDLSRMTVITPSDYILRYKAFNTNIQPEVSENKGKKTYVWEMRNLSALKPESYSPSAAQILPHVMISPADFEIEGIKGNMATWEEFGKFIASLLTGKDNLSDDVKAKVHELADRQTTVRDKVYTLYDFMQKNTRYISIQLGMGGWQPFDAGFVCKKKYGDCKALSNFMVALLKEAGIKGYYVLIYAGEGQDNIVLDFPCNQFNHATVVVPDGRDSIWLECTSQTLPPGYIGGFTSGRCALLIDGDGGHVVHTPGYTADDNKAVCIVDGTIDESGKLTADIKTLYSGQQQDDLHMRINNLSRKELLEGLHRAFNIPTYQVENFQYAEYKTSLPSILESIKLKADNYANISKKRLFLKPVISASSPKLSEDSVRINDLKFNYSYRDIDTINIQIPSGYSIEAMPKNIHIENKFGTYSLSYTIKDESVQVVRHYLRYAGLYPAAIYKEYVHFANAVYQGDRANIVFVKK